MFPKNNTLPISAMVAGFNEEKFLLKCLKSLKFCDEIIYTDLGSSDDSINIAKQFTDKIFERSLVPSCEYIQSEIVNYAKHDWIIFIDPDEVIAAPLQLNIEKLFCQLLNNCSVGGVLVAWRFYFKKRMLVGTVWGADNYKYLLVHKKRFDFLPITHYGRKIKDGFQTLIIRPNEIGDNVLHHFWVTNISMFLKKHFRYLKKEGTDKYNQGIRFVGYRRLVKYPFNQFWECYIRKFGYKDGFIGLFLSFFWAWYQTSAMLAVKKVQKNSSNTIR